MTTATLTITDFLLARIAEDESQARLAQGRQTGSRHEGQPLDWSLHMDRWSPDRVLAECAAHRAIVELHSGSHECPGGGPGGWTGDVDVEAGDLCPTLRLLAAVYAGHESYREDWA